VDVVDVNGEGFSRIPVGQALRALGTHGIGDYVSIIGESGGLTQPATSLVTEPPDRLCVTFDRMLSRGDFPRRMSAMLRELEKSYKVPVDLEFALEAKHVFVLQCRPLGGDSAAAGGVIPTETPIEDRIFSARRYVNPGVVENIDTIVLVDPRDYDALETVAQKHQVARAIGRLNDALADRTFILMGPGRWGSRDLNLGVQVGFGDIAHARALIEVARAEDGYTPEPSFGTHFFQELVEAGILYLPLYPDDEGTIFNEPFLHGSPNALATLSPGDADLASVIRVIDLTEVAPGRTLELAMDGDSQQALAYLKG